jgi:hypothetical protein
VSSRKFVPAAELQIGDVVEMPLGCQVEVLSECRRQPEMFRPTRLYYRGRVVVASEQARVGEEGEFSLSLLENVVRVSRRKKGRRTCSE